MCRMKEYSPNKIPQVQITSKQFHQIKSKFNDTNTKIKNN